MATRRARIKQVQPRSLAGLCLCLAGVSMTRPHEIPAAVGRCLADYFGAERCAILRLSPLSLITGDWPSLVCKEHLQGEGSLVAGARSNAGILAFWPGAGGAEPNTPSWSEPGGPPGLVILSGDLGAEEFAAVLEGVSAVSTEPLPAASGEWAILRRQLGQLLAVAAASRHSHGKAKQAESQPALALAYQRRLRDASTIAEAAAAFLELTEAYTHFVGVALAYRCPAGRTRTLLCLSRDISPATVNAALGLIRSNEQLATVVPEAEKDPEPLVLGGRIATQVTSGHFLHPDVLVFRQRDGVLGGAALLIDADCAWPDAPALDSLQEGLRLLLDYAQIENLRDLVLALQNVDTLTGLCNEHQFYALAEREFDRARRYDLQLALLLIDIDHFRDLNEAYGPEAGDSVIKDLARLVAENVRNADIASRYGKERFVVLSPETPNRSAEQLADRIRRYIENYSFFVPNSGVYVKVTASIGVASYIDHKPASLAQLIEFADTALYFAKRNGRNQVRDYGYILGIMIGETRNTG